MPVLLPVLLRLVTATSLFSLCYFLYGHQLKASRKKHRIQISTETDSISKVEELNIPTATTETNKPYGNDDSHGNLPISSFLRKYLQGGRTRNPGSCRADIGIASVSHVCHPRLSFSGTEINTFGLLYLYRVVRSRKMQEQHFGEAVQVCSSNLEETLTEELGHDGQSLRTDEQMDPTIADWPHPCLEEFSLETSPIEVQNESEKPNEELFDSATSMTFLSDNEISPPLESQFASLQTAEVELELIDSNKHEDVDNLSTTFEDSGNNPENLVCLTPESDHGIETLCYDEDASTSEECEEKKGYYSGTLTFQQEREPTVYWNKDFQDLDWHQRTCSPIAEEPDEEDDELYQYIATSGSGSSITDSSSDLVFETIFSTSQNPEEINDNDLADLKDDPDFVQLLLQNNDDDYEQWHGEDLTYYNDDEAEYQDEEHAISRGTMLLLEDNLEISMNEPCGGHNDKLQTMEDLASQLTNTIILEAQCTVVDQERLCSDVVQSEKFPKNSCSGRPLARMDSECTLSTHEIGDGQVEQCVIENLASNLAKDIVEQVISRVFGMKNLSSDIVPTMCSELVNEDGQSPIEDFASQIANAIIIEAINSVVFKEDEDIPSKNFVQSYKIPTISSDTIAGADGKFDLLTHDKCSGQCKEALVEDMASQLEEGIITQAHKTVVNIDKFCAALAQTCLGETFKEIVKLRHPPPPSSSIDTYALKLATDICQIKRSFVNNNKDVTSLSSQSESIPEKLCAGKSLSDQYLEVPKFPIRHAEILPEMLSISTQTDVSIPCPSVKKPLPSLHTFSLHPETISRIPKQLRYKVWKRLRKAKRKYECITKHHEELTSRVYGHVPESFVTQASDGLTALSALVLAHSIRRAKASKDICILLDKEISPNLRLRTIMWMAEQP